MKPRTRELALAAVFCAAALAVHTVEAQIPPFIPVPGVKPGLANAVTLFALFTMGAVPAAFALTGRVILGAFFGGGLSALMFSSVGGLCAFLVTLAVYKRFGRELAFVTGAIGGVTHNVAQLAVAVAFTRTPELFAYLPLLVISGIVAGSVTGLLAGLVNARLNKR